MIIPFVVGLVVVMEEEAVEFVEVETTILEELLVPLFTPVLLLPNPLLVL